MAWRWRKSLRAGWLRINFSKTGVGWSLGPRFGRVGVAANGRKYVSFGIPGTGLYYFRYIDWLSRGSSQSRGATISTAVASPSTVSISRIALAFGPDVATYEPDLNTSLQAFGEAARTALPDETKLEIALFSLGAQALGTAFVPVSSFFPPKLPQASSVLADDAVRSILEDIEAAEPGTRTVLFLLLGTRFRSRSADIARRVELLERQQRLALFAIGVGNPDIQAHLQSVSMRAPLMLRHGASTELFTWILGILQSLAGPAPPNGLQLEAPTWADP